MDCSVCCLSLIFYHRLSSSYLSLYCLCLQDNFSAAFLRIWYSLITCPLSCCCPRPISHLGQWAAQVIHPAQARKPPELLKLLIWISEMTFYIFTDIVLQRNSTEISGWNILNQYEALELSDLVSFPFFRNLDINVQTGSDLCRNKGPNLQPWTQEKQR